MPTNKLSRVVFFVTHYGLAHFLRMLCHDETKLNKTVKIIISSTQGSACFDLKTSPNQP